MSSKVLDVQTLLTRLATDYPGVAFTPGKVFCWSPKHRKVQYDTRAQGPGAFYALLHELGHALLEHNRYTADFELVAMEVAAWQEAKRIAEAYDITIDENHIQDCLDTYRDWLHRRSICPSCGTQALQQDNQPLYTCHNCHETWRVSSSRFCRPYRQIQSTNGSTLL